MKVEKPKFPIILVEYRKTNSGDLPLKRKMIFNEEEKNEFISRCSPKNQVKSEPLTTDDLKSLPLLKRVKYKIPKWVYLVIAAIGGLFTILKILPDVVSILKAFR